MKVAVSAEGTGLDAAMSPVFGRCAAFVFVDTETMASEGMANASASTGGGAGTQAAQAVAEKGVAAVLSSNVGPNAFQVLNAAGIEVYRSGSGSVRQAVEDFKAGRLERLGAASAAAHGGMRHAAV